MNPYLFSNGASVTQSHNVDYLAPVFTSTSTTLQQAGGWAWEGTSGDATGLRVPAPSSGTSVAAANNIQVLYPNGPYATDNLLLELNGISLDARLVGAGIKLRCNSAPLYRTGSMLLYEDPTNAGYINQFGKAIDVSATVRKDYAQTYGAVDGEWHSVTWKIRDQSDLNFMDQWTGDQYANAAPYDVLGVFIDGGPLYTGASSVGMTFEFECVWHFELTGPLSQGRTLTPSNIQYLSKALAAIPPQPSWDTPSKVESNAKKNFWPSVGETALRAFANGVFGF
jgi:hypothetical protein